MTRLSRNLIFNVVGQGLVLALSFVAAKYIFRLLGDDLFGIIYFNITLATVVTSILELGVLSTTNRQVSLFYDTEPAYVTNLIRTASFLYWSFGVLILVVIFITAPLLVHQWVNLRTLPPSTAITMIRILSIGTLIVLPRSLYTSLFRGRQRMGINNVIDVTTAGGQQIGVVVILKLGGGAYVVGAWMSATMLAAIVVYLVVAGRMFGWRALIPAFDMSVVRRNVSYTALMFSNSLLSLAQLSADKVVVSKLLPVGEFGLYAFVSGAIGRATFVAQAIGQAAFPLFARLHLDGDRSTLLTQFRKLQDLVSFLTLPMFAVICFGASPVLSYVFNPSIANRLLLPTALLAVGFYLYSVLIIPFFLTFAIGKPNVIVNPNAIGVLIVVVATIVLVILYGITGAALSLIVYDAFAFAYIVPRICRQCLEVAPWSWYLHLLKAVVLAVPLYGGAWLLATATDAYSLLPLAIGYVVASICFVAGSYLLIGSDLRDTLLRLPRTLALRRAGTS
jgi:O-antigen/teichoic acid export membrane protein